jgi:hypothetical protein
MRPAHVLRARFEGEADAGEPGSAVSQGFFAIFVFSPRNVAFSKPALEDRGTARRSLMRRRKDQEVI